MATKNAKKTTKNTQDAGARNDQPTTQAQRAEERFQAEGESKPIASVTPDGEVRETRLSAPSFNIPDVNMDELERLETMERGYNYQPQYIEFDVPGQTLRALYMGKTIIDVNDTSSNEEGAKKKLTVAMFLNAGGLWLQGGVNLLRRLEVVSPMSKIEVEYTGLEKTKSGNKVKIFDVYSLKDSGLLQQEPETEDAEAEAEDA